MQLSDLKWVLYASLTIVFFSLSYSFFKLGAGEGDLIAFLVIVTILNFVGHFCLFLYFIAKNVKNKDAELLSAVFRRVFKIAPKVALISCGVGFFATLNDMSSMLMFKAGAPLSVSMPIFTSGVVCLTVLFGVLAVKERLDLRQVLGIVMIVAGIGLFNV